MAKPRTNRPGKKPEPPAPTQAGKNLERPEPDQGGTQIVNFNIRTTKDFKTEVKTYAYARDMTISEVMMQAFREYREKRGD